jgi:hypothetical protein
MRKRIGYRLEGSGFDSWERVGVFSYPKPSKQSVYSPSTSCPWISGCRMSGALLYFEYRYVDRGIEPDFTENYSSQKWRLCLAVSVL